MPRRCRPIRRSKREPLNEMLRCEGHVRILRELARCETSRSTRFISALTFLDRHNVRRSLTRLVEVGIVRPVGRGTSRGYQLDPAHPIERTLRRLFQLERDAMANIGRAGR